MPVVPIDADHVRDDRRGGLDAAGARPLERDLADRVALEHDRVEGAVDRSERVVPLDERRPDADVDAAVHERGGADEPDDHAEVARGVRRARGVIVRDAAVVDVLEPDARAERDRRENRHLRGRVGAVDVVGRVGLRVPELLRLGERVRVGAAAPPSA